MFWGDQFLFGVVSFGSHSHNTWLVRPGEHRVGNVQGPFETLFVFTDIFSFGLSRPISAKEDRHAG